MCAVGYALSQTSSVRFLFFPSSFKNPRPGIINDGLVELASRLVILVAP